MRYRKLSPTGDYSFGNGQKDFYTDVPAAPGQAVVTRLRLFLGEWYLNISEGTPYIDGILGKKNIPQADTIIRSRALDTQGVISVSSFQSTFDSETRRYSVTLTVQTIYGVATLTTGVNFNVPVFPVLKNELITQSGFVITTESGEPLSP